MSALDTIQAVTAHANEMQPGGRRGKSSERLAALGKQLDKRAICEGRKEKESKRELKGWNFPKECHKRDWTE